MGVIVLAALWLLLPLAARAAEIAPNLSLRGFYTLDASVGKGADTYYPSKTEDPSSVWLKDGRVTTDFSLVGVQADLGLSDRLSFTAQAVSSMLTKRRDYAPALEWAYLTYDLGDDLYLRGGKFKTPLLQGTELKYVGYSRLWVRPLIPSSGAGGFDDYKGLELIKSARLGDYSLRLQGAYGEADHVMENIDNRDIKLVSARLGRDQSWVNLALLRARYDIRSPDGRRQVAEDTQLTMGSVETELWFDRSVVNAGYAHGVAPVSPHETMRYLSLGYRLDPLTPYVLYHDRSLRFSAPARGAAPPPPPGPPRPPGPPPPALKDGTHSTRALAFGLRYDLGATQAVKAQVERQFDRDDSDPALGLRKRQTTIFSIVLEGTF
jgi:hypothetical protein